MQVVRCSVELWPEKREEMKFILIFGPQAVGKMTVGHELEKTTDLKLFHNHMAIELVTPFFDYGTESGGKLVYLLRKAIFEEVAQSDLQGLIFTYVWALDDKRDWDYVEKSCDIFRSKGGTVYFVELEADMEARIERNRHPHRLAHKPTKRNLDWSEKRLREAADKYRLNSVSGEIREENYLKIDNTDISAEMTAAIIKDNFDL